WKQIFAAAVGPAAGMRIGLSLAIHRSDRKGGRGSGKKVRVVRWSDVAGRSGPAVAGRKYDDDTRRPPRIHDRPQRIVAGLSEQAPGNDQHVGPADVEHPVRRLRRQHVVVAALVEPDRRDPLRAGSDAAGRARMAPPDRAAQHRGPVAELDIGWGRALPERIEPRAPAPSEVVAKLLVQVARAGVDQA